MKIENLCINCMKEKSSPEGKCEHCGYDPDDENNMILPHHLSPFVILAGKYLVGKAIGEGGFGITYIGMDLNLEMRVAIKEYYPNGFAIRDTSRNRFTVQSCSGDAQTVFEAGREKFINEAKILAKCIDFPGIVKVKDFFKENNTAYIVMEYLEGQTLKSYLKEKGGRISVKETIDMMMPLIKSLGQIHKMGLIHRDISPDNIMITNGGIKLLDFGGARDFVTGGDRSKSIMLKPGYSPEEQYRTHGEQGPWTDIYALCATMYRCITGKVPQESIERAYQDNLKHISELRSDCFLEIDEVICKGLGIYKNDRWQSMEEFNDNLQKAIESIRNPKGSDDGETPSSDPLLVILVAGLSAALIVLLAILGVKIYNSNHEDKIRSVKEAVETVGDGIKNLIKSEDSDEEESSDKGDESKTEDDSKNEDDSKAEETSKSDEDSETDEDSKASEKTVAKAETEATKTQTQTPTDTPLPTEVPKVATIDMTHIENNLFNGKGSGSQESLYIWDCLEESGRGTELSNTAMPATGIVTIPILYTVASKIESGEISLNTPVSFKYVYDLESGGRGNLGSSYNGQQLSMDTLLQSMLMYSDNNATNSLIDFLTLDGIQQTCNDNGFESVTMRRKLRESGDDNTISAQDITMMIQEIYDNEFDVINRDYLLNYMKIVDGAERYGIFQSDTLYNNGNFCNHNGVRTGAYAETGIIFADGKQYIVSVMANGGDQKVAASEFSDAVQYIHSCM